jgi:hypothetical protein
MSGRLNGLYLATLQRFVEEVAPDLTDDELPAYALDFARRFQHHPGDVVTDILEVAGVEEPKRPTKRGGALGARPSSFPAPQPQ